MSSRVPEPAWRLTKRQPPCASACTFSGTGVPGRSIRPCRRQWLPISLCVPGCSSGRSARRKTGEACASRGTWKPATVQRPSSRLRSASSLPAKRRLRCSACCASASATSRGRPRSWLANRSSTCSAGSSASAKTRAEFAAQRLHVRRQPRARLAFGPQQPLRERRQPGVPALGPQHQRRAQHGFPLLERAPHMPVRLPLRLRGAADGAVPLQGRKQVEQGILDFRTLLAAVFEGVAQVDTAVWHGRRVGRGEDPSVTRRCGTAPQRRSRPWCRRTRSRRASPGGAPWHGPRPPRAGGRVDGRAAGFIVRP